MRVGHLMENLNLKVVAFNPTYYLGELQKLYDRSYRHLPEYCCENERQRRLYFSWLSNRSHDRFLGIRFHSRWVGFIVVDPRWISWKGQPVGEVHELIVDPALRGQGLGSRLLQAGIQYLVQRGRRRIELWVGKENHSAQGFYYHHGFRAGVLWNNRWQQMLKYERPSH